MKTPGEAAVCFALLFRYALCALSCDSGTNPQYVPDPDDCAFYRQCVEGGGYHRMPCGTNTFWDQSLLTCTHFCGQTPEPEETTVVDTGGGEATTIAVSEISETTEGTGGSTAAGFETTEEDAMTTVVPTEASTNQPNKEPCTFRQQKEKRNDGPYFWTGSVSSTLTCAVRCESFEAKCQAFQVKRKDISPWVCFLFEAASGYLLSEDAEFGFYERCHK